LDDNELKEMRLLIESMQSALVELFDELTELRKRLDSLQDDSPEPTPRVIPLFSEVSAARESTEETVQTNDTTPKDTPAPSETEGSPITETPEEIQEQDHSHVSEKASSVNAKVSRVLDPIALELRTGEASAEIVFEFLQTAKDYLIDDDSRKEKVARDIDVVLRFLKARGKRAIRDEERENILKRMERWKAHLVAYTSSPVR
jgi:hypothetical protein